jgi:hypothetical protein
VLLRRSIADGLVAVIVGEGHTEGVLLGRQRPSGLRAYCRRRLHLSAYAVAIVAASGYRTYAYLRNSLFLNCRNQFMLKQLDWYIFMACEIG